MHTLIIPSTARWDVCQLAHLFYANRKTCILSNEERGRDIRLTTFFFATQNADRMKSEWVIYTYM